MTEEKAYDVSKPEEEWRTALSPEEYIVLREAGTERPWTGELLEEHRDGVFCCKACGNELFRSNAKFESGSGWPSFYEPVRPDAIELIEDKSLFMKRVEARCGRCGSHLGHVFDDAPQTPTGDRYCMNSLSLDFDPKES
ncbi:MAG: peptide-methionine (R)-S-oxide reductase [Frankiales bacterium]|jgi:peptide-methionine (R)-S-oxide reductase|nr:peptide-methionine (R)-S-oxide reductase [Frankiales bacterium]